MDKEQIIARAKERNAKRLELLAKDGVRRVLAAAEEAGLLRCPQLTIARPGNIYVRDVMEAAEVEPRVLEILPALLMRRKHLVQDEDNFPVDLRDIVWMKQRPETFRGMDYQQWMED